MPDTPAPFAGPGALIAIGGHEDRTGERVVLRATLDSLPADLAGPPRVAVLTAASMEPARLWDSYGKAFAALGAEAEWLDLRARADADSPRALAVLGRAQLLFMTGGDQLRLAGILQGSAAHRLMLQRHREQGLCIAGTSAGASVMGVVMPGADHCDDALALATCTDPLPTGLALLPGVVIDQHFSQRQRLARLINLVTRRPGLLGLGIDEDTAAIIRPGPQLTVVGSGSITLVDTRCAHRRPAEAGVASLRQLALHQAAAGSLLRPRGAAGGEGLAALLP